jgi:hypothetical protein
MTYRTTGLVLTTLLCLAGCDDDNGNGNAMDAARDTGVPDVVTDRPVTDMTVVDNAVHDMAVADTHPADAVDAGADTSGADAMDAAGDTESAPTFTQVYTTVIMARCLTCHIPGGIGVTSGMLDMSTKAAAYTNLVNVAAAGTSCSGMGTRIVPGMPDSSILYLKVSLDDPTPCGGKMPLGGPALTEDQANLIEEWIDNGALND